MNLSTDLGTALWYSGRADAALAQDARSLAVDPTHAQTLFNIGMVKRDGKQDLKGAIESWEKLLQTNPDYPDRTKVEQMLAQARQALGQPSPVTPMR